MSKLCCNIHHDFILTVGHPTGVISRLDLISCSLILVDVKLHVLICRSYFVGRQRTSQVLAQDVQSKRGMVFCYNILIIIFLLLKILGYSHVPPKVTCLILSVILLFKNNEEIKGLSAAVLYVVVVNYFVNW